MNNNNNIYQDNYDKKPIIIHNSNSNSYYYLDIINNKYKNSKSSRPNNHSTININYDDKFNPNFVIFTKKKNKIFFHFF